MSVYVGAYMLYLKKLLTDVHIQMPHSLDPSHPDSAFHPLKIVQAGIHRGS